MEDISEMSRDQSTGGTPRLSRPLGPLETMYHLYHKRGVDHIVQLMALATHAPVTPINVRQALVYLMKKHPILRMCIKESSTDARPIYRFNEMDTYSMDLRVTGNTNYEEILQESLQMTFDYERGPLWRMILITENETSARRAQRESSHLKHSLEFAFSCHHSIADGLYLKQIYTDFVELIYLIHNGNFNTLSAMNKSMFLPPIESILPVIFPDGTNGPKHRGRKHKTVSLKETEGNIPMGNATTDTFVNALDAYQAAFRSEIATLSRNIERTGIVRFKFNEGHSRGFLLDNKAHHVTVTSSCITAACMSLTRLLESSIPSEISHLTIPVEIMVNLRRYVTDKTMFENYPGCAAIHIPLTVSVPLRCARNRSSETFWKISQQCTEQISDIIASGRPIEFMREETERELNAAVVKGKSPFVLCLTNLSKVDDMVKPELKKNFKLMSFPSLTRIGVDDMPIFFLNVFTLNKELHVNIGYCDAYTSPQTAAKYAWYINDAICRHSRL